MAYDVVANGVAAPSFPNNRTGWTAVLRGLREALSVRGLNRSNMRDANPSNIWTGVTGALMVGVHVGTLVAAATWSAASLLGAPVTLLWPFLVFGIVVATPIIALCLRSAHEAEPFWGGPRVADRDAAADNGAVSLAG